jgi:hypothetical protein
MTWYRKWNQRFCIFVGHWVRGHQNKITLCTCLLPDDWYNKRKKLATAERQLYVLVFDLKLTEQE